MSIIVKKMFSSFLALSLILLYLINPVMAAGPIGPVGPQEPVGPVEQTGNIAPTGTIEPTGTNEPTGNVEILPETKVEPIEPIVETPVETANTEPPISTEQDLTNNQSGPNSENHNQTDNPGGISIDLSKDTNIDNNADLKINTGENTIGQNTAVNNLGTGSIDGSVNFINIANSQFADGSTVGAQTIDGTKTNQITLNPSSNRIDLQNDLTGPNSENTNLVDQNNLVRIFDQSNANVLNEITIDANTGRNLIDQNTKIGNIKTGDINLATNLVNLLNLYYPNLQLSMDIWSILGDYTGDIFLSNQLTGPNSENKNLLSDSRDANISVIRNSDISNDFDFQTNTGVNQIGANTMLGNVTSGDTAISGTTTNIANVDSPMFYIFNVFGEWDGSFMGIDPSRVIINEINDQTGPNSENTNIIDIDSGINAEIEQNADVDNKIRIKADTGHNDINNNTVVGSIKTGSIKLMSNVVNVLNSMSSSLGKFSLGIINIFGNWKGNLADKKQEIAKPTEEIETSKAVQIDKTVETKEISTSQPEVITSNKETKVSSNVQPVKSELTFNVKPSSANIESQDEIETDAKVQTKEESKEIVSTESKTETKITSDSDDSEAIVAGSTDSNTPASPTSNNRALSPFLFPLLIAAAGFTALTIILELISAHSIKRRAGLLKFK